MVRGVLPTPLGPTRTTFPWRSTGRELFAVDGCKLPSNASRTWSGTQAELVKKAEKMEQAISHLLAAHQRQDAGQNEDALQARERQQIATLTKNSQKIRAALKDFTPRLNKHGKELKSNLTDPDSATMRTSHGVVQGYTGVAAVDAKAQIIVHAPAFGTGQENGLLPTVVEDLRKDFDALGKDNPLRTATLLTDSGYHSEATLQKLADLKVDALIADTGLRARDPRFAHAYLHKPKDKQRPPGERRSKWFAPKDFEYDPQAQTCRCPHGSLLKRSAANAVIKGRRGVSFEGTQAICVTCPLRAQCLRKPDISPYRQVAFFDGSKTHDTHPHTTAMKARIDTREGRLLYGRRLGIVEPVFGNLHNHRLRRFTLRSRRKVDAQWKLFALVHNVQKLQECAQ